MAMRSGFSGFEPAQALNVQNYVRYLYFSGGRLSFVVVYPLALQLVYSAKGSKREIGGMGKGFSRPTESWLPDHGSQSG